MIRLNRLLRSVLLTLVGTPLVTYATCDPYGGWFDFYRDDGGGGWYDDYAYTDIVYYDDYYYDDYYYDDCFFDCF